MGCNKKDSLGDRMKGFYENRFKSGLVRRMPVIIRIDGKAFHTFTKGFDKPFDEILMYSMQWTTLSLCKNIQGCVLGYTQSDEITLVLVDYKKLDSAAWFDYEIQKICSVSASMATFYFNLVFNECVDKLVFKIAFDDYCKMDEKTDKLMEAYKRSVKNGAFFDSRCFNVPLEEVTNCLLWRQEDAVRNSVQMLAQHYLPQAWLFKKNTEELKKLLEKEKNVTWDFLSTTKKRGSCVIKTDNGWTIDNEIPIFKGDGREYIEKRIRFDN